MMDQSLKFDIDLINRYDKAGPRYTSYPTALELHEGFTDEHYRCLFIFPFAIPFVFIVPVIKLLLKIENIQSLT